MMMAPVKTQKTADRENTYVKPGLVEYGAVTKLTAGTGTANGDSGPGMMVSTMM